MSVMSSYMNIICYHLVRCACEDWTIDLPCCLARAQTLAQRHYFNVTVAMT